MSVPGLYYPKVPSYTPGAGNPQQSAYMAMSQTNARQANLNNSVSGGRRRTKKRGGGSIAVPQFPQPGASANNATIAGMSKVSTQSVENAKYDNLAGGVSRRRRHKKKARKSRKSIRRK